MSSTHFEFRPSGEEIVGTDLGLDELTRYLEEVARDNDNDNEEEEFSEWITRLGESVFRPSKEENTI